MDEILSTLRPDERAALRLRAIYQAAGYRRYRMSRFEEYSLYASNLSFLHSERVITFSDVGGRLMALKPDITLSIVNHTRATRENGEKLYYAESVFRADETTREFRELGQVGLERIGQIDLEAEAEVLSLAAESLSALDPNFVLGISHMGAISTLLDGLSSEEAEKTIVSLRARCAEGERADRIRALCALPADFDAALSAARKLLPCAEVFDELESVRERLSPFASNLRLDFTISSDFDYYNGIIFCGSLQKVPHPVLTGGRYDLLLARLHKDAEALGFAVSLEDLARYYPEGGAALC